MKNFIKIVYVGLLFVSLKSYAVIIDQDGISYSCTPLSGGSSCEMTCVTYCTEYKEWPFTDWCMQKATACESNAKVMTICSKYASYPFEDRCLQQIDIVTKDENCY